MSKARDFVENMRGVSSNIQTQLAAKRSSTATINNSDWSGTGLEVAKGGTGASTASAARTSLGVVIGTDVQAYNATYVVDADIGTTVLAPTGDGSGLSGIITDLVGDTSPQLGGNLDLNGFSFTGLQVLSTGADIASTTSVDLTAATGNTVVITGTTPSTSLTMTAGQQMVLLPSGAWPLTYHATTMNINGGVSYTATAGDRITAIKDLAGVIRVSITKQDGTALVAPASGPSTSRLYFSIG